MKYHFIYILLFLTISFNAYGQDQLQTIQGKVTFVTSKNIYVKFNDTQKISIGDSLQISTNEKPCLLVKNKSSSSVVCSIIDGCNVKKDDIVYYKPTNKIEKSIVEKDNKDEISQKIDSITVKKNQNKKEIIYIEKIKARFSVASYSNLSSNRDDKHRVMTRLSINANHINNSKFSIYTYLNYRQNFISGESSNSIRNKNRFNVYNLALRYDIDTTLSITIGRKINYKASSLGAIDGIQVEKYFNKNYVGVLAGFRPDIFDYGFNSDLFQYGAYFGRQTKSKNFRSQTTLGFAEQQNDGEVDRRYTYFQHSSTLFKKLNLFSSMELDIYGKVNGVETNDTRLTNLYISTRYRFSRKINLALSYDSRKRILYYETFQTDIERLLDEDIARQGIRARINIKPIKHVYAGFSYSKRFQNDSENKSDNIYGYVSLSRIPTVGGRISLTYNMNSSNYLDSNIASIRYSRPLLNERLHADFYYRFVNYVYTRNIPEFNQNFVGTNLSYYISKTLILNVSGEFSTYDQENNFRINTRIIKRFYRHKKK